MRVFSGGAMGGERRSLEPTKPARKIHRRSFAAPGGINRSSTRQFPLNDSRLRAALAGSARRRFSRSSPQPQSYGKRALAAKYGRLFTFMTTRTHRAAPGCRVPRGAAAAKQRPSVMLAGFGRPRHQAIETITVALPPYAFLRPPSGNLLNPSRKGTMPAVRASLFYEYMCPFIFSLFQII